VASAAVFGWYFAGRTRVLRELVTWLNDPDLDHRARVVTGDPGSGKSAVLARLVTLAQPEVHQRIPHPVLRAAPAGTLPPPGAIDAAIHARNKTLVDVLAALAAAINEVRPDAAATAASPDQQVSDLVDRLIARPQRRVVILDALDEATDPKQLATQLLRPLLATAAQSGLRLLISTRRHLVKALGDRIVVLDLDDPAYLGKADLAEYVTRVLVAEHDPDHPTPYRGRRELAEQVGRAVADRAQRSFLIARMVAQALVTDDDPVETSQSKWALQLPSTVGLAFEGYLERFGPNQQRARDLLAALAFAEGGGLPKEFWVPVARSLSSNDSYGDDDVAWVLRAAADYLLEVPEHDRVAYRLYHEALAEHLRSQHPGPDPQRRLTQTLCGLVPATAAGQPSWEAAHPYVRAHLASHAAAAGELDRLLTDPGFLPAADPDRLLRVLPAASRPGGQQAADVYRSALYHLRGRALPVAAAQLQLAARQAGADDLAERVGRLGLDLPWSVPWAHYRRAHSHLTLGTHTEWVSAVAVTTLEGRPIAITAGVGDSVRIWDVATGTQLQKLTDLSSEVIAVAVTTLESRRPIAVTGGSDGTVRVWDVASGTQLQKFTSHTDSVRAVALTTLNGRPIAITSGGLGDATVRAWDLAAGTKLGDLGQARLRSWMHRLIGRPWPGKGPFAIAVTSLEGRPIAVTGGADGSVRVWDVANATQLQKLTGHTDSVNVVAVTALEGRPIAVTGSDDRTVRVWDVANATQLQKLTGHTDSVNAVAVSALEGRPIAVTGGFDGSVRVWDVASGTQLQTFTGHIGEVNAVAVSALEGRPIAVTGGFDRTVRVWDLVRDAIHGHDDSDDGSQTTAVAVAVSALEGRPVIVTGGVDGSVRVWDMASGTQLQKLTGHTDWVSAVAVTALEGRPIAVAGGGFGSVRVWDLSNGTQLQELTDFSSWVTAVAVITLEGRPIAIAAGDDGSVRVWDVASGTQLQKFTGHIGGVTAVAVTALEGRPIVVAASGDGTVRVWDMANGTQLLVAAISASVSSLTPDALGIVVVGTPMGLVALRLHRWQV
jgi:WD40 repeat protein